MALLLPDDDGVEFRVQPLFINATTMTLSVRGLGDILGHSGPRLVEDQGIRSDMICVKL